MFTLYNVRYCQVKWAVFLVADFFKYQLDGGQSTYAQPQAIEQCVFYAL